MGRPLGVKVILGLALMGASFSDWLDLFSRKNLFLYGFPERKDRLKEKIEELCKIGEIERKMVAGKIFYRLTSKGSEKLFVDIPIYRYESSPWDGLWRIVIYDIPEKQRKFRQTLQTKLKSLAFGQWQRSVWVSPHPVLNYLHSFIRAHDLDGYIQLYEAKSIWGNHRDLAGKIWNLDELNAKYSDLLTKISKFPKQIDEKLLMKKYRDLLMLDPGLPRELLPSNWAGDRVRKFILNGIGRTSA